MVKIKDNELELVSGGMRCGIKHSFVINNDKIDKGCNLTSMLSRLSKSEQKMFDAFPSGRLALLLRKMSGEERLDFLRYYVTSRTAAEIELSRWGISSSELRGAFHTDEEGYIIGYNINY